jgi:membrane protease YdiL (CAAX protease family)
MLLLAAPVLEELAFRGAIQESLLRLLERRLPGDGRVAAWRAAGANGLTAALFALAHALHRGAWLGWAALPAALVIGMIYDRRRRVLPCILVHAALNAGWILLSPVVPHDWF